MPKQLKSWARRWFTVTALTVVFSGCTDESVEPTSTDDATPSETEPMADGGLRIMPMERFAIGGVVDGLVGSVTLNLSGPELDEELTLEKNGPFEFRRTLAAGDAYEVSVLEQPEDEHCYIEAAEGVVDDTHVSDVLVICDPGNPGLEGVALSVGELQPEFSVETTRYRVDVPLWIERLHITPDATDSDVEVTIAEQIYREDAIAVDLDLGQNTIELSTIAGNGDTNVYTVDVYRAARVVEAAYGKVTIPTDNAQLGYSMSLSGDLLAVGAPNHSSAGAGINSNESDSSLGSAGAVFIFERTEAGWKQDAFIKPEHPGESDLFGISVSLVDELLVVGAPGESSANVGVNGDADDNSAPLSGAVYLFQRGADGWEQTAYLKSDAPRQSDGFGNTVQLQRDGELEKQRIAVGAYRDSNSAAGVDPSARDDAAIYSGAVYVFEQRAGGWAQTAYIKSSNPDPGDAFGESLTLSDNTLVVGSVREQSTDSGVGADQSNNEGLFAGAAYVFDYNEDDERWAQSAYLKASNAKERMWFGNALSLDGDTLAVAAFAEPSGATGLNGDEDDTSEEEAGAVYIFDRDDGDWTQTAYIKASNSDAFDHFGSALVLRGTALAVGASQEASAQVGLPNAEGADAQGNNDAQNSGAVYTFFRKDGVWTQHSYIKASNAEPGDNLGFALGFDGVTLAAGAPFEDSAIGGIVEEGGPNNVAISAGAVYWFK